MSNNRIPRVVAAAGNSPDIRRVRLLTVGEKPLRKARVVVALCDAGKAVGGIRLAAVKPKLAAGGLEIDARWAIHGRDVKLSVIYHSLSGESLSA